MTFFTKFCPMLLMMVAICSAGFLDLSIKGDLRKPLVQYVAAIDFNFQWSYNRQFTGPGYTVHVLNLTSQRYIPPGGATPEVWRHYLSICVPDNIDIFKNTAELHIDEGTNTEGPPTTWSTDRYGFVEVLCQNTRIVTAYLSDVPSQPYIFGADPTKTPRTEDGILAYGWARLLNDSTHNPLWIQRLAMVKSAVKAMDAIQDFSLSLRIPPIFDFIVSGASKRGWTTWLTAAVDRRVKAIIPVVMPIQNMLPNLQSIFRSFGNWGFAFADYVANGVTAQIPNPDFHYITDIEDPINYNAFIDMPKLVIIGTKDEFFVPDQPKFFFKQLIGEKHLVAVPNGDHPAINSRSTMPDPFFYLANTSFAFINQVTSRQARPTYNYKLTYSNDTAQVEFWSLTGTPSLVRLWSGTPPKTNQRDFRLFDGATVQAYVWGQQVLQPVSKGYYRARVSKPAAGWTGFFIDAQYKTGSSSKDTFFVTTEVNVVPDRYPFRPCYETNNC